MEADFSGYATKNGLKCADGRIIHAGAFKEDDGLKVPLVWQHQHNEPVNVLGHAVLENREDGVYAFGFFNDSAGAENAKTLVKHGDITALSIYANGLVQKGADVIHGAIREVSLVLSGANPGAFIDNVNLAHGNSTETLEDEAIIYTGLELEHAEQVIAAPENTTEGASVADDSEKTIKDVFETFNEEQKKVLYYMIGEALDGDDTDDEDEDTTDTTDTAEHSDSDDNNLQHNQEGNSMTRNVFEGQGTNSNGPTLSHAQLDAIVSDAQKSGSFKEAFLAHAVEYGIENIDLLFPDAKAVTNSPEFIARRSEWVAGVISGTKHSPFSRIKSLSADLTFDDARAKGYIKGNLKKDEFFALAKRTTGPTTVYKKQKLDRDDIIDITDLDVVAWLKAEMRLMLDEELAGAVLVGDGRDAANDDKIKDPAGAADGLGIRSISHDSAFYAPVVTLDTDATDYTPDQFVDGVVRAREEYEGTGNPTLYTSSSTIIDLLLQKDTLGRRLYATEAELTSALRVSRVVELPSAILARDPGLLGIIVNLSDYTLGADKGGNISMFDDFDIDYNQYKYLIETRVSGALTKAKSAIVIREAEVVPPVEG